MAAEPTGDAQTELERVWLAAGRAEAGAAHGVAEERTADFVKQKVFNKKRGEFCSERNRILR